MNIDVMKSNAQLAAVMDTIGQTAGYLWQKGWAERNGGNLSVNLSVLVTGALPVFAPSSVIELEPPAPLLAGNLLYITASGARMRDVARDPYAFGCFISIAGDGSNCHVLSLNDNVPSSELPSHLLVQQFLKSRGNGFASVLHTHPTELIALTHCPPFLEPGQLSCTLLGMIPEAMLYVPGGVGLVAYQKPGTLALARSTISALVNHDVVLWEKHGVLAVGVTVEECFDSIDILNKSAQIFLAARQAGYEAEGLPAPDFQEPE